jgi:hypothetical protein
LCQWRNLRRAVPGVKENAQMVFIVRPPLFMPVLQGCSQNSLDYHNGMN